MLKFVLPHWIVAGAASLAVLVLTPSPIFAAGGGGEPPPMPKPKPCGQYKEGSSAWKRCMSQSLRDDNEAYAVGYWLAKTGHYDAAIDVLRLAKYQADPRIQTMIGFSLRKLGMVDEAMAYYEAALRTDPNRTSTRQYLGEAFLQKGERNKALDQLAEIGTRCGTSCEDYQLLAKVIAAAD